MAALREIARTIFQQALADCSVKKAIADAITVRDLTLHLREECFDLSQIEHIEILAVGKAAAPMLQAALAQLALAGQWKPRGVLIAPQPLSPMPPEFRYFAGGHPSPNEASFAGARAALDLLREQSGSGPRSLCLFLISGGSSAMMELPLDPAVSLTDTIAMHRALVASGASITEINCVRKHFSAVKGGRLALAAGDAICRTLLASDVPAGQEDALGSGPTIADTSTVADCRRLLEQYRLLEQFPASVRRFFESSELTETPKPHQLAARAHVLLSAVDLAQAAKLRAEALGFHSVIDNSCDEWNYQTAAEYLLDTLRVLRTKHARVCLISAGEVIVRLPPVAGQAGAGGRNQQFALHTATLLLRKDGSIAILSVGSDGIDGNSPAAGAVIDQDTLGENSSGSGQSVRASAVKALEIFDTYPLLARLGVIILTGPTGNNLRDLRLLLSE